MVNLARGLKRNGLQNFHYFTFFNIEVGSLLLNFFTGIYIKNCMFCSLTIKPNHISNRAVDEPLS